MGIHALKRHLEGKPLDSTISVGVILAILNDGDGVQRNFTPREIKEIRESSMSGVDLAERYSVTVDVITNIRRNRTYYDPDYVPPPTTKKQKNFTDEEIRSIRREARSVTQRLLAAKYGVSPATICNIVNGVTYKHVPSSG